MPFIIAIVAIIAILGIGGYVMQTNNNTETATTPTELQRTEETAPMPQTESELTTDAPAPTATPASPTGQTYTGRGEYLTPARTSHIIDVTLTVADGVVTDASIIYDEGAGFSNPHQERFDGAYKTQVIGKRLEDINLSRVGGASVTSRSFNEVIDQIEAQIQA